MSVIIEQGQSAQIRSGTRLEPVGTMTFEMSAGWSNHELTKQAETKYHKWDSRLDLTSPPCQDSRSWREGNRFRTIGKLFAHSRRHFLNTTVPARKRGLILPGELTRLVLSINPRGNIPGRSFLPRTTHKRIAGTCSCTRILTVRTKESAVAD